MEGHDEEPAIALGLVARATRIITGLGHFQGPVHTLDNTTRRLLRGHGALTNPVDATDSDDDEDDEDYMGEDDDEEEEDASYCDGSDSEECSHSVAMCGSSSDGGGGASGDPPAPLNHVIAHSTAVRCVPSEGSARLGKRKGMVNVMTMLKGREFNASGNGKFSRAECCHVGARFLPTDGPSVVERLNSRAYIGQFSRDGTLFVAGFQVRFWCIAKGYVTG